MKNILIENKAFCNRCTRKLLYIIFKSLFKRMKISIKMEIYTHVFIFSLNNILVLKKIA